MRLVFFFVIFFSQICSFSQNNSIGDFMSVEPGPRDDKMHLPTTHSFQVIIEEGDVLTSGELMHGQFDFTAYVPINGSSQNGYLSINGEMNPGFNAMFDFQYDSGLKKWMHSNSQQVDFTSVGGIYRACSGAVTPWNTVIACEEFVNNADINNDGYDDAGWVVEIDPVSRTVIDKHYAMGKFKHENVACHPNQRTFYQGADSNPGYLYKFVADTPGDLSSGDLYVYKGPKNGNGNWILLDNSTPAKRENTLNQSANVIATVFVGVEDVEIGLDGKVYMAVKGESAVYRFEDDDLLTGGAVLNFETFVGGVGVSYDIHHPNGTTNTVWGSGNDNLTFDNQGNLYVLQDGGDHHVWIVRPNHTAAAPRVGIFMRAPAGSEPTGMTFTPDNKFMFMSFQHPSAANNSSTQLDAFGNPQAFDNDVAIVVALDEDLGLYSNNCLQNLQVSGPDIPTALYPAKDEIVSNGSIQVSSSVDYRAGSCVNLQPSFEVQAGATFSALIEDCNVVAP